jgi:hypothetical protein
LAAVEAFEVATLLCGALGQTALGAVAQCENVLEVARSRLSSDLYRTASSRGGSLSPSELMSVAAVELAKLTHG